MPASKFEILRLYKMLLREAIKFPSYNFRNYALRKIKDSFKENQYITDSNKINKFIEEAKRNLQVIQRQVIIGQMYSTEKLVIEHIDAKN